MSEAPPFWFDKPGLAAWLLSPAGVVYGQVAAHRMGQKARYVSPLPTICVGNLIAGGAGKTPTAMALAGEIEAMGLKPGFLLRGYGGSMAGPAMVDPSSHNARDVGDEPLLLARRAPTAISADRPAGARLLEDQGIDVIVMDDGFQNPSLHKDLSLIVVDAWRGIGNGFPIPAGPVRATLSRQLALGDALLVIGRNAGANPLVRRMARMAKPIYEAGVTIVEPEKFAGKRVLAFAGIADPGKFHRSLEEAGAEIVQRQNFHDHHPFSNDDCTDLMRTAERQGLDLVTTAKDHARLAGMGQIQQELADACTVLQITLAFDDPRAIRLFIERALKKAREYRIANKNEAVQPD